MNERGEPQSAVKNRTLQLKPRTNGFRDQTPRWQQGMDIAFEAGSVYTLTLQARAIGGGTGPSTALRVELCDGKGSPQFRCGPILSSRWETFSASFKLEKDYTSGSLQLFLVHGWGESSIEVKDVRIENRGAVKPLQAYPRGGRWYAGQEEDAPWRAKAQSMIEKHRKGTFSIQVINESGEPRRDVRIIAEQQRHAYLFGTAVNTQLAHWIAPGSERSAPLQSEFEDYRKQSGRTELTFRQRQAEMQRYFDILKSNFNYAVIENALKWQAWSGDWGGFTHEESLGLIDWLNRNGLAVKAHALVWPGWRNCPNHLKKLADNPQALQQTIMAHITDLGSVVNGRVVAADVLNEPFNNHDLMDILGDDVMTEWFKQSRNVLPDARLNINDFLLMANGGRWTEKLDYYDDLIGRLLKSGAPLDQIGFQSHFRHSFLTEPERIWTLCDRFSRHGLPLVSSEFDLNLADAELQAAYTRDFMTAWFAHPSTSALLFWGFWQDSHWLPYAGLYDRDWRIKPNGRAYRELVFNKWWSGWEEVRTDDKGQAQLRGFLGDYKLTVYADGKETVLESIKLKKEGTPLCIRL
ncbi:MAG: endo-1,4-beta-xylanase [Kiritimatiellales bacterium]|nr:endo-1,4-beta-xylanase [Kiritimatiellales bacterium]